MRVPASRREAGVDHLQGAGIPTVIYYPRPLHSAGGVSAFSRRRQWAADCRKNRSRGL
jgi:hypothetical protein